MSHTRALHWQHMGRDIIAVMWHMIISRIASGKIAGGGTAKTMYWWTNYSCGLGGRRSVLKGQAWLSWFPCFFVGVGTSKGGG